MAKTPTEIASLARAHTESAIRTLANIMSHSESDPARVTAANSLLDRGWGKPAQTHGGDDSLPAINIVHEIRRTIVDPKHPDSEGIPAVTSTGSL
jgi:hypothetical protein